MDFRTVLKYEVDVVVIMLVSYMIVTMPRAQDPEVKKQRLEYLIVLLYIQTLVQDLEKKNQ